MEPKIFDFNRQLNVGDIGEKHFTQYYASLSPQKSSDMRYDFVLLSGDTVELKTDTYDMEETPNFFMEMFGNAKEGTLGGPWRALKDNLTFFVYYFPKNKTFFWFSPATLCNLLEEIIAHGQLAPKNILNKGWEAIGYVIPREHVKSVMLKKDVF